jgi:NitT/TauT family transport system ATP-binding protein
MTDARAATEGATATAFLRLQGVGLDLPGHPGTLQDIHLALAQGEFHCLLGRSGCGKTSLLKVAAGLRAPTRGRVHVAGPLGLVFQAPNLLEWLSVLDNVLLPVSLHRRVRPADRQAAMAWLARLGLQGLEDRRPRQLSGGQQSRVAIARALLPAPPLLLLDEPFAALDALTREDLQADLLAACREAGTTVLFVTHDIAEAAFLADRVSVMAAGRLASSWPTPLPRARDTGLRASAGWAQWGGRLREALQAASGAREVPCV